MLDKNWGHSWVKYTIKNGFESRFEALLAGVNDKYQSFQCQRCGLEIHIIERINLPVEMRTLAVQGAVWWVGDQERGWDLIKTDSQMPQFNCKQRAIKKALA